jgi:hypothetical protein
MNDYEPGSAFEVEVATVEEFLRLLAEREEAEVPSPETCEIVRRAVFVAQLLDRRSSGYGYPAVRRYVVAAFVYERDIVSYKRTTSSAVELPNMVEKIEERQQAAYEEIRAEIERGLEERGLGVPICEGSLRHPSRADEE